MSLGLFREYLHCLIITDSNSVSSIMMCGCTMVNGNWVMCYWNGMMCNGDCVVSYWLMVGVSMVRGWCVMGSSVSTITVSSGSIGSQ